MRPILLFILIITSFSIKSEPWDPIKIFDRVDHIETGIYLGCFGSLSNEVTPNTMLSQNGSQFEILLSFAPPLRRCSPLPPEFIDKTRHYFNLGNLAPGNYSITVNYVTNDAPLPPANGVQVETYAQLDFQITGNSVVIPTFNWFGLFLLILLMIVIARFVIIKQNILKNN